MQRTQFSLVPAAVLVPMVTKAKWPVFLSGLFFVLGVAGILTIAWLFPGRPRTRLTYFGPTALMLMSALGLVGLIAQAIAFVRSKGK